MEGRQIVKNSSFISKNSSIKDYKKKEYANGYDKKIEEDFFILNRGESEINSRKVDKKFMDSYKSWYRMAFSKSTQSKKYFNSSQIQSNSDENVIRQRSNKLLLFSPESKITLIKFIEDTDEKKDKKSIIRIKNQFSSSHLENKIEQKNKKDPEDVSFLENSTIACNSEAEQGLRRYFNLDKQKFKFQLEKGPPENFRWLSWIISSNTIERSEDRYYSLLKMPLDKSTEIQIKKDLHRTLSDDTLFTTEKSRTQLCNVLRAISNIDKELLYCQGMNCIAAFCLLKSNFNEVDSFYLMLSLLNNNFGDGIGIRGFYLDEFPLLQLYLYQFDYIFFKKLPNLKQHFENLDLLNDAWVSKWFQTLFTISMPIDLVTRLWDCIFANGIEFMFKFTLAILTIFQEDLLKFNDMTDLTDYLKGLNPYLNKKDSKYTINIEKLIEETKKINIPTNVIENLRKEYENKHKIRFSNLKIDYGLLNNNEIDKSISLKKKISSINEQSVLTKASERERNVKFCDLVRFKEFEKNDNSSEISISCEFDSNKNENNISQKVSSHVLKSKELKTICIPKKENIHINQSKTFTNLNKIDLKGISLKKNLSESYNDSTKLWSNKYEC